MVTLQLRQLDWIPGQRLVIREVSWPEMEAILEELTEGRGSRMAYSHGVMEIKMPLPEHEFNKEIIGDLVKILLDELDLDRECFGSTTFKRADMSVGIEPDNCFYIQSYKAVLGKKRIDLMVDPPPDLAIEVDLTSKTRLDVYEQLGVPELWRFDEGRLRIDVLQTEGYVATEESLVFAGLPVIEGINRFVALSREQGSRMALKGFRAWVGQVARKSGKPPSQHPHQPQPLD